MSLSRKSIWQQTELTEVDYETGEKKSVVKSTVRSVPKQPNYIKLYLRDILYLSDLQTNQSGLLYQLLMRTTFGTNEIVLNSHVKKQIAEELGISIGTIDNNLSKFVEGKILERIGRGVYVANPYLFGNGEWSEILQLRESSINLSINYERDQRSFQAVLNKAQEVKEEEKERQKRHEERKKKREAAKNKKDEENRKVI